MIPRPQTLDDLAQLTDRETQGWLRETQSGTLAVLLKAGEVPFADKMFRNISEAVAEFLRTDATKRPMPSPQGIEAARSDLISAAHRAIARVEEEIAAERPRFEQALSAAEAGDVGAMITLASFYEMGIGTRQDPEEALRWYSTAASHGFRRNERKYGRRLLARLWTWLRSRRTHPAPDVQSAKPNELLIRRETFDDGYSELFVRISPDGELVLDGCDAGERARETFGDWDFEYWLTVSQEWKDTVLLYLVKERFTSAHDMETWLEERKISGKFTSY